ncbi:hypothetical protein ACEWY4_021040 [Coilia grayii]|uniref:B30.2/SPRY domain-containing protein n=1 Tax=Coilia grayii TaxID=363190 RepID=A0ABD1J7U8_9TELE
MTSRKRSTSKRRSKMTTRLDELYPTLNYIEASISCATSLFFAGCQFVFLQAVLMGIHLMKSLKAFLKCTFTFSSPKLFSATKKRSVLLRPEALKQCKEIILKLGKLAFQHLERPKIYFSKTDLVNCEIEVPDALKCPGLCAELLKMESGLYSENFYCFVHLSVQEFLAALYAFHEFVVNNHHTLQCFKPRNGKFSNLTDFLNAVVDEANKNKNGRLDLFIRFLFGISVDSSVNLLNGFLPDQGSSREHHKKVIKRIKSLRAKNLCPDRCVNLVHCLVEIGDKDFLKDLKEHKKSQAKKPLTPFQCSALAYQLVRSDEKLDVLDLKQYRLTEDCYHRLAPAIPYFRKVLLNCIGITKTFCPTLASALCVPNARLTELDLSLNCLQSGMMFLSRGLCSPNCQIERLNLSHSRLTRLDVNAIQEVLKSPDIKLKELDLSNNDFGRSEVDTLCAGLRSCRLHVLSNLVCQYRVQGCAPLRSPLLCFIPLSYFSLFLALYLFYFIFTQITCTLLCFPCRLSGCSIDDAGCYSLGVALQSGESNIKHLDLSYNSPGDQAHCLLLKLKDNPSCALEIVEMDHGGECRNKQWLHKYAVDLTLDQETANGYLHISSIGTKENKKVKRESLLTPYPDHQDRFDSCNQVLCNEGLTGRHYWEVEKTSSEVYVGVAYKSMERKGVGERVELGRNSASWSLFWSDDANWECFWTGLLAL